MTVRSLDFGRFLVSSSQRAGGVCDRVPSELHELMNLGKVGI